LKLVVAAALLVVASAWSQTAPASPAQQPQDAPQDLQQPAPPELPEETPPEQDYGGPAILSRGGGPSLGRNGDFVHLRPFVTVNAIYDSGLGTTSLTPASTVPFRNGYGVSAIFGVTGKHLWKRSILDLDYRGTFRHYNNNSYYDGMDNSLMLSFEHQLTPHTKITLAEDVARYQRAFSLPLAGYYNTGFEAYDPTFSGLTTNDLFDTPTTALMSVGRLIHQMSARWSFSVGGTGFFVRRHSAALIGTNGFFANGDLSYRISRYQTFSLEYTFGHFDFQNRYGQSDTHGVSVGYSVRVGRYWELGLLAGAYRVESIRLTSVQLDPVIAAILGQTFGIEKFYNKSYVPRYGLHITRRFQYSDVSLSYNKTILAGNGVYTTSGYQMANLGYSYHGFRRVSLQVGADYTQFSSLTLALGRYRNYSGGAGFGYKLGRGLSLIGRADARRYNVANSSLNRVYYRGLFGFGWSPGDYPLSLW
jgi:hypothetical protein